MRKLSFLLGAALLSTGMSAVAAEGPYVGPSITKYFLDKDRTLTSGSDDAVVAGANLGYKFANGWGIEGGLGTGMFADDDRSDDIDVIKLDALYWLADNTENWAPFLVAGYTDFDRDDSPVLADDEDSTSQLGLGLGVSKMVSDQFEVRADARLLKKLNGGVSDTSDLALNVAMNYYFNKPAAPVVEPKPAPVAKPKPKPEMRTITVRLNVQFEFDKAVVRAIYGDELLAVANAMKAHDDIELVLEGHTDYIGTEAYNQDLSQRRADAVKAKLTEVYGIPGNRISTVGYGESRPIADNSTDEGRAINRRVIGELSYTEVVSD